MKLIERYETLIKGFSPKEKKYIHYRSLKNFINHLEEIKPYEDYEKCRIILDDYLEFIEHKEDEINTKDATILFADFIYPLGELYKKNGFKEITPIKNLLFFSIHFDLLVLFILLRFFFPISTAFVLLNYFIRQRKYAHFTKVFGIFY